MELFAATKLWRWPDARAVISADGWAVAGVAGPGDPSEAVLPADVSQTGDLRDSLPRPRRLREPLQAAADHLLALNDYGDERRAAEHLAEHYREYGSLDLCRHGRPMWHSGRPGQSSCEQPPAVLLDGASKFARELSALVTGGRAASARRDLPSWVVEALEPTLSADFAGIVRAELGGGQLSAGRRRQVLELSGTQLMADCRITPALLWSVGRGPGLALQSETTAGLYAFAVLRTIGRADPKPVYSCQVCGDPVQLKRPPRPGEGVYCRRADCQRARYRTNKQRARVAAAMGSQEGE